MNVKSALSSLFMISQTPSAGKALASNVVSGIMLAALVVGSGYAYYRVTETYRDIETRREAAAPLVARMVEANAFAADAVPGNVLTGGSMKPRRSSYLFAEFEGTTYSCGFNPGTGVVNSCSPVAAD